MIFRSDREYILNEVGLPPMPEDKVYTKEEAEEFYRLQYEHLENFISTLSTYRFDQEHETVNRSNTICPSCRSENINERIKRFQGSGSGSMNAEFFLLSGRASGSSSFNMDTNEVLKCNDCNHEWKKAETHYRGSTEFFGDMLFYVKIAYGKLTDRISSEKTGKGNWLKKGKTKKEIKQERLQEFYEDAQREDRRMFGYCREVMQMYFREKVYGMQERTMKVLYDMPDEYWELWGGSIVKVKKTHWEKFKGIFKK